MKTTMFQVGKPAVFSNFSKDLPENFYVILASVFDINQNVNKVNNNKNIKIFS